MDIASACICVRERFPDCPPSSFPLEPLRPEPGEDDTAFAARCEARLAVRRQTEPHAFVRYEYTEARQHRDNAAWRQERLAGAQERLRQAKAEINAALDAPALTDGRIDDAAVAPLLEALGRAAGEVSRALAELDFRHRPVGVLQHPAS